jgi:hypothetical protein
MDDREQQRKVRHRLAVLRHAEEVSGNVAATCRHYGISVAALAGDVGAEPSVPAFAAELLRRGDLGLARGATRA